MFTLLTVIGAEVFVSTYEDLKTAVIAYRRHVIDVQKRLENTRLGVSGENLAHPSEFKAVSLKMEHAIGAWLYASNWQAIFARYEPDSRNVERGGW